MLKFAATYILTLLLMLVIDGTWIALVALPMFRTTLGQDMLTARVVPAVLFYLVYAAGIGVFVLPAGHSSWSMTALNGALFGLFTYATYELRDAEGLDGSAGGLRYRLGHGDDGRGVDACHGGGTDGGAMVEDLRLARDAGLPIGTR